MSLKPPAFEPIPVETIGVARAAFPKGNLCIAMRDERGIAFCDADFRGSLRAALSRRLALITIMQFLENSSNLQAAEAVRAH